MNTPTETSSAQDFRTPPRILIPKLVGSRDKWKAKATARKRQYRKERIRSRDLAASRARWKERAMAAEQKVQELQQRLECVEADRDQTQAELAQFQDDVKKN